MGIYRHWLAALAVLIGLSGSANAQPETLRIGVIPYLTPNLLISLFQPVRQQLENKLGTPVDIFTAPDVRAFARRTLTPDFDIVITAAHQARLAQLEGGYLPLARFTGPLKAALIVSKHSPIQGLGELKGKRIAVTDRSILVNIAMTRIMAAQGIAEKDVRYLPVNSQNTGILTVARGDAEAAIIAHFSLDQSPPEQRDAVRIIHLSETLPNVILLASPKLPANVRTRIRDTLLGLPDTPEGASFLERSRFQGVRGIDEAFMKTLDPYLAETRRHLGL